MRWDSMVPAGALGDKPDAGLATDQGDAESAKLGISCGESGWREDRIRGMRREGEKGERKREECPNLLKRGRDRRRLPPSVPERMGRQGRRKPSGPAFTGPGKRRTRASNRIPEARFI